MASAFQCRCYHEPHFPEGETEVQNVNRRTINGRWRFYLKVVLTPKFMSFSTMLCLTIKYK
jgi:hypothetical protein